MTLSMESFIEDMLKNYSTETKPKATPATAKLFDLGAGEELDDRARKDFHSNVMRLMYLSQRLRPDIALAVIFLCTRVKCPTTEDKKKLDRVMGYLRETKSMKMTMNCKGEMKIIAYIDAAFGTHHDGKSHTGCAIYLGSACIWTLTMGIQPRSRECLHNSSAW